MQRRRRLLAGLAVVLLTPAVAFGVMRLFFFSGSGAEDGGAESQLGAIGGRKHIYDRNFNELAVSFRLASIYARPLELKEPEKAAKLLAANLGVNEAELLASLKAERSFVWVGRQIPQEQADKIAEANLKGIYVLQRAYRYYPQHEMGGHVVGFVKDEQGLAGIESYYDNILRGGGAYDPALSKAAVPAAVVSGKVGAHVVTTLDLRAQRELEGRLQHLISETKAQSGAALMLLPANGEILAMASAPTYDPNRFWAFTGDERKNRAIVEPVYPGGLRAIFWLAAALEKGNVTAGQPPTDGSGAPVPAPQPLVWNEAQEGVYLSPELLALAGPAVPMPAEEKRLFAQRIGLCGEPPVDLPEGVMSAGEEITLAGGNVAKPLRGLPASCDRIALGNGQAATDTVSLVSAFSRLLQSGPVAPHLLLGLSDGKQLWRVPPTMPTVKGVAQPIIDQLRGVLAKQPGGGQGGLVVMESLVRQDLVAASEPAVAAAPVAAAPEKTGQPAAAPVPQAVESRYHAVLLATTTGAQPGVAMVIVLNGAQLDLGKPSPSRAVARELASQALHYAAEQPAVPVR
ncbi:MAG TPA: penicillin-binding transpeptidase domain-containing protein, partial [Desulfurivibrionaceae bacterium]|nr:penicillin-binding transpeptidase domain-containing protein [Desulfurivibrionaceae bacterium]